MVKLITTDSYFNLFKILVQELEDLCGGIDGRNVVFCEEKISLMAERAICSGVGGSFNTDVYSFGNFMRVKKHVENVLSNEGSAMVVKRILSTVKLDCFKTSRVTLAPTLAKLIMQLKSAKITPYDLSKAIDGASGALKSKLIDVYNVYFEYEKFIKENGYEDQSSSLADLPSVILESEELSKANVFIVGFSGFTAQMRSAIEALIKTANSVTAILCKGDNPLVYVNETADYVKNYCKQNGLPFIEQDQDGGFCEEGKIIAQNLFNPSNDRKPKKTDKIFYASARSASVEIEKVAEIIKTGVMNNGNRYRQFTLAVPSIIEYKEYVKRAFDTLEIPYFLDERKRAENNPMVTLINAYVDVFRKNFERKALSAFYKNPLFEQDKALTDAFENYVIENNVNYGAIKKPFVAKTQADDDQTLELFRQRICNVFDRFDVKKMLKALNVDNKSELLTQSLKDVGEVEESAVNEQVYGAVVKILDEMQAILGGVNLSANEFKTIFSSAVSALEVSIIPQYNDAVFVGEYKQSALVKADYLFAVGLTSSVPTVRADVALISDGEIDALEQIKVLIEPKIKIINHRTRENLALALASFEKALYVSYPITALDGEKNVKSEILNELESLFTFNCFPLENGYLNFKQGLKTFAKDCGQFIERETGDFIKASSFFNVVGKDRLKHLLNYANKEMKVTLDCDQPSLITRTLSPTTIEDYYQCPYRAFLSRTLKLKPREDGNVKPFSVGNLMHDVFSTYFSKIDAVNSENDVRQLFDTVKEQVLNKEEYKKFLADARNATAVRRALNECEKYCIKNYNALKSSNFKVERTEASFGEGNDKDYPAVKLCDNKYVIKGKIDRVDVNDDYFRVLDYKTGTVDAGDKSLFSGVKVQLYLYAAAVKEKYGDQKKIAGLYYLPVENKYHNSTDDEISLTVGKTLDDQIAVAEQDEKVAVNNKSEWFSVDKKGNIKNLIEEEQLNAYVKYAVELSSLAAERMAQGVIVPSPYEKACQYCEFKSMCDGGAELVREPEKVTKTTIMQAVEGEKEDAKID